MSGWQPIETAPKDGTVILLMQMHRDYTDSTLDIGHFGFLEVSDYDRSDVYDWFTNAGMEEPTHWMPLPAPPSSS